MLDVLAQRLVALSVGHPLRVAVDGIDAAGKTTLADELVSPIEARGRPVIRASIDGFHRPRVERYRRGADSPEGYYLDAFDYPAVRDALLLPLGPFGTRRYRHAVFDFRTASPLLGYDDVAPAHAILLMDGVFLLRPELDALWDARIFVDVPFEVAIERALRRDLDLFGSADAVRERYERRYLPAQRLYLEQARPRERADIVVQNADPSHPSLLVGQAE